MTRLARDPDPSGDAVMTQLTDRGAMLPALDDETACVVRLAAVLTVGSESDVRVALSDALAGIRPAWVEEVILQTYLFAGFPRALNAAREWRRVSGRAAPTVEDDQEGDERFFVQRGEVTCATVYGDFYSPLRNNIKRLHPALDTWMIVGGYGRVLGRPQLDLARRELCIVASCAVARQDRQLHSHLHGARNAGASDEAITQTLDTLNDLLAVHDVARYRALWTRVRGR